jgi:hypothetical protein
MLTGTMKKKTRQQRMEIGAGVGIRSGTTAEGGAVFESINTWSRRQ